MFAGAVSDRARSDPSKTQAAARPSHNVLSLRDNQTHRDGIFLSGLVMFTCMMLMLFNVSGHKLDLDIMKNSQPVTLTSFLRPSSRYVAVTSLYF